MNNQSTDTKISEIVFESINFTNSIHFIKPFKRFLIENLKLNKTPLSILEVFDEYQNHLLFKRLDYSTLHYINDLKELITEDYIYIFTLEHQKNNDIKHWIGLKNWFKMDNELGLILKNKYTNMINNKILNNDYKALVEKYNELNYRFENQ